MTATIESNLATLGITLPTVVAPLREGVVPVPKVGAEVSLEQAQVYSRAVGLYLLIQMLGKRGGHTRSAIGVGSLPKGFAVEIESIIQFT